MVYSPIRTSIGLLGLVLIALLHWGLYTAAAWGEGQRSLPPTRPDAIGAGANAGALGEGDSERRMIVRLLEMDATPTPPVAASLLEEALNVASKLEITGPDSLPLPPINYSRDGEEADSTDAELIARATMLGVYQSQILARIQRSWVLPRALTPEQAFSCRASVTQDESGRVSQVELPYEGCDISLDMRQSIVNAIFSASPMPAPPHPGVFVDTFTVVLRSDSAQHSK